MRGRILVAVVAALAMALAAPRNARCCERPCSTADALILTVAAAGVRSADAFKRMSLLAQLLAAAPEVTFAGFLDAMVSGPQLELGGDGVGPGLRLSVLPTFSSLGSLHQTGLAVAGRF